MGGELDDMCPLKTQQVPIYEGIDSKKYLVILKNADHLAYCDFRYNSILHEQIKIISTAFWMIYLKNDIKYQTSLLNYISSQKDMNMLTNTLDGQK